MVFKKRLIVILTTKAALHQAAPYELEAQQGLPHKAALHQKVPHEARFHQ